MRSALLGGVNSDPNNAGFVEMNRVCVIAHSLQQPTELTKGAVEAFDKLQQQQQQRFQAQENGLEAEDGSDSSSDFSYRHAACRSVVSMCISIRTSILLPQWVACDIVTPTCHMRLLQAHLCLNLCRLCDVVLQTTHLSCPSIRNMYLSHNSGSRAL